MFVFSSASIFLIHPSGQSGKFTFSDIQEDLYDQNPLKGKPRTSEDDLPDSVKGKIAKDIYNVVLYDAENVSCLYNFSSVKKQSQCLFAKRAKIWGSPDWNNKLSLGR
jgi:hypothetical protein